MHPAASSHLSDHTPALAARLDALFATAQAAPMPQKDMTVRKDADQPRRTTPRLAFTARP
jgi:hypothetical protein